MELQERYQNEAEQQYILLTKLAAAEEMNDILVVDSIGRRLRALSSKPYFPWLLESLDPVTNRRLVALRVPARKRIRQGVTNYLERMTSQGHIDA